MGFLLSVITDTALPLQVKLRWFESGGFGEVWDSVISSREIRVRKPKPEIDRAALCQLGLTPERVAFVGHKKSELDEARNVGLKTIAFNYEADYYIHRFAELLQIPLVAWPETIGQA